MNQQRVEVPEPTLQGDDWICAVQLPAWAPFLHSGPAVEVIFLPPGDSAPADSPPSLEQRSTLQHVVDTDAEIFEIIVAELRAHYDAVRPEYLAFLEEFSEGAAVMPPSPSLAEFANLHDLQKVYIHVAGRDGLAYFGFQFHAAWEIEHGIGVLLHDRRVVDLGGADTAFLMPRRAG